MSQVWSTWWRRYGIYLATLGWLPLALIASICFLAYRDAQEAQDTIFQFEMSKVRTIAVRNATQLEMVIADIVGPIDWSTLRNNANLLRVWNDQNVDEHALFAAVVDPSGNIILHTDSAVAGQSIGSEWYDFVVHSAGGNVVKLQSSTLSQGQPAYDLRIPVVHAKKVIADYHVGLNATEVDQRMALSRENALKGWAIPLLISVLLSIAAYLALIRWTVAIERCHQQIIRAEREHARELNQIAGGLAHEIRNPLHALRMNLHVLGGVFNGKAPLDPDDLASIFSSSAAEVNHIDQIIRELLRYAVPDDGIAETVNLTNELQATLTLMQRDVEHRNIEVHTQESEAPTMVSIDPSRFRQALVNVLTFAQGNAGPQGRVDVALTHTNTHCELDITDSGPTLPENRRPHIFEPFQATHETGSGLGLALVKSCVERAGGTAVCVERPPRGNRIVIRLPRLNSSL